VARLAAEADVSPADFVQLPEPPDLVQHGRTIRDLQRQHRLSEREATLLYEHNTGDPPLLAKKAAGGCVFLVGRLCSIYAARPFICQL
jgi:Fe-S-cluster containining protein